MNRPSSRPQTTHSESADELVALIPDLERLSRLLTRDPVLADDLTQEVLSRVWARIADGTTISDLRPYVMASARNLMRRAAPRPIDLAAVEEPFVLAQAPGRLALRNVARALSRMPGDDCRLLLRQAAAGESYSEIARAEGLPLGTVMSRLSRLRRRLRHECGVPEGRSAAMLLTDDGPSTV